MKYNIGDEVAYQMAQTLKDAEFQKMFASSINKRASVEENVLDVQVDDNSPLVPAEEIVVEAGDAKADCIMCGKPRKNWTEADGVCKCASTGCSLLEGCKDGCDCGCKEKTAAFDANIVKLAFETLMEISETLENEGFEGLSGDVLNLASELVVEAKAKKVDKNKDKADKEKMKEKAAKEKEKALADKNKAKEKLEKEKTKMLADKNKAREKADKEKAKDKADKEKEKAKADKAKADLKKKVSKASTDPYSSASQIISKLEEISFHIDGCDFIERNPATFKYVQKALNSIENAKKYMFEVKDIMSGLID